MRSLISAPVRLDLVSVRVLGMTTGVDCALATLKELRKSGLTNPPVDAVALGLLESEINYLDGRPSAAFDAFTNYVEPTLEELDPKASTVIADNKFLILFETMGPEVDQFYHLVDQRRILSVELRDYAAAMDASMEAAKGKHYEALPIYWQQLRAAYRLQNWRATAMAERDFARECMSLGWLSEAAYHAMLSRDEDTMQLIADALVTSRSSIQLGETLRRLLPSSCLKKHAIQVALLLRSAADAVSENQLDQVMEWLSMRASLVPSWWHDAPLFQHLWEAIEAISPRLASEAASSFVSLAIGHPLMAGGTLRRHLLSALNALCPRLRGRPFMPLANATVSLLRERKSDIDYTESVNLLCQIAHCGGDEIKAFMRASLFPGGTSVNDTIMIQAAHFLGCKPEHPESFSPHAQSVAAAIRKQVQHLTYGETTAKIGGYGTVSRPTSAGHDVVHINGAEHLVRALIPYRHLLDAPSFVELIRSMLAMITDSDNIFANRISLTLLLREFMDRLPDGIEEEIAALLDPLADGHIIESGIWQTYAEATNPLNRFKGALGDPANLRGAALLALAKLDHTKPGSSHRFHKDLLLKSLTSPIAEVRRYGLAAAEVNGRLTPAEQTVVMLLGLDPDPKVAGLAMRALSGAVDSLRFSRDMWHIIVRCLEAAVQSFDAGHRWAGAQVINAVAGKRVHPELRERFASATTALREDICYSVRTSITEPKSK